MCFFSIHSNNLYFFRYVFLINTVLYCIIDHDWTEIDIFSFLPFLLKMRRV
jgi:hypothetical protein